MSDQNNFLSTPKSRKATQLCHVNLLKPDACESKPLSAVVTAGSQFSAEEDDKVTASDESLLHGQLKKTETLHNFESLFCHLSEDSAELSALFHSFPGLLNSSDRARH